MVEVQADAPTFEWSRVRRVEAHPFGSATKMGHDIIRPSGFRLRHNEEYHTEGRNYHFEGDRNSEPLEPSFRIDVDRAARRRLQLDSDQLRLSVIVKDHATKRYVCDRSLSLDECPVDWTVTATTLEQIALPGEVDFSLTLTLCKSIERRPGLPWLQGHILAKKLFSIRGTPPAPEFPVRSVPPSSFIDKGLPGETSWTIHFLDVDFNKPANEVFQVWVNDTLEDDLHRLEQRKGAAHLLWAPIQLDVLFDLLINYLKNDNGSPPTDKRNLNAILENLVCNSRSGLGLSLAHARSLARSEDPYRLRARLQAVLDFGQRIRAAAAGRAA